MEETITRAQVAGWIRDIAKLWPEPLREELVLCANGLEIGAPPTSVFTFLEQRIEALHSMIYKVGA